jgi:transcriptional regulator with XRE-family HTH domain
MEINKLPIENDISNNELHFEETDDFGRILRILRENQGYTIIKMSKMISIAPERISKIERSLSEIPNEQVLRIWLTKLGCKDNLRKLMLLARKHRVVHWIRLHAKDESNADLIRLLDAYRDKILTDFDRALLGVIARE